MRALYCVLRGAARRRLWVGIAASLFATAGRASAWDVRVIPIPANSLVWDPGTRRVYATVGSKGRGDTANSITTIDPTTGEVVKSVYIGSEPGALVLSDKGKYLYVAVGGAIRRYDLATQTPGPQFPVGEGLGVSGMVAMPGDPESVIVMRRKTGLDGEDAGVTVYENGVPKPNPVPGGDCLCTGIHPSRLFTYESRFSTWRLNSMYATKAGVVGTNSTAQLMQGNTWLCGSANGLVVNGGGAVIDPEARQVVGTLPEAGMPRCRCTDSERHQSFRLMPGGGGCEITGYDLRTFAYLGKLPLPNVSSKGILANLIRWGDDGLAFTNQADVAITEGGLTPKLQPVDLSVKRSALPATIQPGAKFAYTLTVTNNSEQPSSGAFLTECLPAGLDVEKATSSQGNAVPANGVLRADLGALPAGASAAVSLSLQATGDLDGSFVAVVRGCEPDPATENNVSYLSTAGSAGELPDLGGTWAGLQQGVTGAGVDMRVTLAGVFTVRNIGKQPSRPCLLRFYLSEEEVFQAELAALIQQVNLPALPPGETYRAVLQAPLRAGADATGFFVYAVVDATKVLREADKNNNVVRCKIP